MCIEVGHQQYMCGNLHQGLAMSTHALCMHMMLIKSVTLLDILNIAILEQLELVQESL